LCPALPYSCLSLLSLAIKACVVCFCARQKGKIVIKRKPVNPFWWAYRQRQRHKHRCGRGKMDTLLFKLQFEFELELESGSEQSAFWVRVQVRSTFLMTVTRRQGVECLSAVFQNGPSQDMPKMLRSLWRTWNCWGITRVPHDMATKYPQQPAIHAFKLTSISTQYTNLSIICTGVYK